MSFDRFTGAARYIADPDLIAAVDAAVALERPLLIKGEPGTGKTRLAEAVSESLEMPLLSWHIKSTTKAVEGLYTYDVVQRLNDARFGEGDVRDIRRYIHLGPMGESFASEKRVVLLIDEIDKADLEFPNDLLRELDEMKFTIPELKETVEAKLRPVVIITTNAEKELPDAFLRRCVFHYLNFPPVTRMKQIIDVHLPGLDQQLVDVALARFYGVRKNENLRKPPSTSELLDWLMVLSKAGVSTEAIVRGIPFVGVLVKQEQDLAVVARA
jgi:MoxR-like ATPase